jgi:hypothetical protein
MKETSSALTKGAEQFADLESRVQSEESALSGQLKKNWGFDANTWGGDKTTLPMCQVPGDSNLQSNVDVGGNTPVRDAEYWEQNEGALDFAARAITSLLGDILGRFVYGAIGLGEGIKSELPDLIKALQTKDNAEVEKIVFALKVAFQGADGMMRGGGQGKKYAMELFESLFGKDPTGVFDSEKIDVQGFDDCLRVLFSAADSLPIYENYIRDLLF